MKISPKAIWITVIVVVLVIVTSFVWQEWDSFSIYNKIDHDKFAAFASAIAAILTAATVYLLYRQNQEQIKQRKSDFEPFIVFYDIKTNLAAGGFSFEVMNIGRGPARSLRLEWRYNYEEFVKEFGQYFKGEPARDLIPRKISHVLPSNKVAIERPVDYFNVVSALDDISAMHERYPISAAVSYLDIYNVSKSEVWSVSISKANNYLVRVKFEHNEN
ncbi:MAG: hypothetical protein ACK4E0_06475 [Chitinophagaceae bacterium]